MNDVESEPRLYLGMLFGPTEFYRDAGIPFHVDVVKRLSNVGFTEETTAVIEACYPDSPRFPPDRGPIASIDASQVAVGIGLYMAGAVGNGLVDQLLADAYQTAVKPALSKFWSRLIRHRQREIVAVFDHWFNESGILVRVEFVSRDPVTAQPDEATIHRAIQLAAAHVLAHGVTHRVIAFRAIDGRLNETPRLAEPVR